MLSYAVYLKNKFNHLILFYFCKCSNKYLKVVDSMQESPEVQKKIEKLLNFFEYAKNKTGIPDTKMIRMVHLHNNVRAAVSNTTNLHQTRSITRGILIIIISL